MTTCITEKANRKDGLVPHNFKCIFTHESWDGIHNWILIEILEIQGLFSLWVIFAQS